MTANDYIGMDVTPEEAKRANAVYKALEGLTLKEARHILEIVEHHHLESVTLSLGVTVSATTNTKHEE